MRIQLPQRHELCLAPAALRITCATEWQVRICYHHYKKMLQQFPDSPMGGFTRLLHRCLRCLISPCGFQELVACQRPHVRRMQSLQQGVRAACSGKADALMDEMPTAVVDRLPEGLDQGFVVLNRPYGFLQWMRRFAAKVPEPYILMIEPDYIFIRPPPLW